MARMSRALLAAVKIGESLVEVGLGVVVTVLSVCRGGSGGVVEGHALVVARVEEVCEVEGGVHVGSTLRLIHLVVTIVV